MSCRLIFTGSDASTVSHWEWHKDTAAHPQTDTITQCFSSLKQIDFLPLYQLLIFKAGKGQHIGSCCLPMFATGMPLKWGSSSRFWVQCLHSAWRWETEPSPHVKAFTEFSLNLVSSGILDILSKTTRWESSLQLSQFLPGRAALLSPYRAHPPATEKHLGWRHLNYGPKTQFQICIRKKQELDTWCIHVKYP